MSVKTIVSFSLLAFQAAVAGQAWAQSAPDALIGGINVNGLPSCSSIDILLNRPVTVTGQDPIFTGSEVTIKLQPMATVLPSSTAKSFKETGTVAANNIANVSSVVFDPAATVGPTIHLSFAKPMAYRISQDKDLRHILLAVASVADAEKCVGKAPAPEPAPAPRLVTAQVDEPAAPKTDDAAKGDETAQAPAAAAVNTPEEALKEGKKLLTAGDFSRATAYLTKATSTGTGATKQEAQEMLGLSRERAGQMAFARAEYETYLKAYPGGANAARVKDRLDGIMAAMETAANKQFAVLQAQRLAAAPPAAAPGLVSNAAAKGNVPLALKGTTALEATNALTVTNKGIKTGLVEVAAPDPKKWVWEKHGDLSSYYYSSKNFTESVPGSSGLDTMKDQQNEVQSTAYFSLRGENEDYAVETAIDGFVEKGFGEQSDLFTKSFGGVYLDGVNKTNGFGGRVGRQSTSKGGVFGRFDGGIARYEANKDLHFQAVAGVPVYRANDLPFTGERYFYGASMDYTLPNKKWGGGAYAIEQDITNIVDRRAIGADVHYQGKTFNAYSAADFDLYYMDLNNAYLNTSWTPKEGVNLYANFDYRKVPFLLTSNALSGQTYTKLTDLVNNSDEATAKAWASDRTAASESVTIGGSYQMTTAWQIAFDATLARYSGTPDSGVVGTATNGLDFVAGSAAGTEFYAGANLSGFSIFKENDSLNFDARYSLNSTSKAYMGGVTYNIPINDKARLSARMRGSYVDTTNPNLTLAPSLNVRYKINKQWSLESTAGIRWQHIYNALNPSTNMDVTASTGYRFDF
jgi:hypothetical protein